MSQRQQQYDWDWLDGPPGGGVCPVCGACVGVSARPTENAGVIKQPSLLLELSGSRRQPGWRLTIWGEMTSEESIHPVFDTSDIQWRYVLCGNGHYFLRWVSLVGEDGQQSWRYQTYVAAIGPVASGKSYLLTRTLNQSLTAIATRSGQEPRLRRIDMSDPLESVPRRALEEHYQNTVKRGVHEPMPPTLTSELQPGRIFVDEISPRIPEAAKRLQEAVTGRARVGADVWGFAFRQPIFLRSKLRDQPVLTCVADLAGELFDTGTVGFAGADSLRLLRRCDALIWVVDPFHSPQFEDFLREAITDETHYQRVLRGSSRPGSLMAEDSDEGALDRRSADQENLARTLANDQSPMTGNIGGTLRNLVAITKCDLFELALDKRKLSDLCSEDGGVEVGVARYLLYLSGRDGLEPTPAVQKLINHLCGDGVYSETTGRLRREQIAGALVTHYSTSAEFWSLTHDGKPTKINVSPGRDPMQFRYELDVPGIDEHLRAHLQPNGPNLVHMRDVVMSALGCGVMFGLGNADYVEDLLRQNWRYLQFFLCSPLGTVPLADDDRKRILPSSGGYPKLKARSAGLTQLNLAIMREALL
ncbi:MAG: hypothetical protein JO100_18960 [Pseudonocardia sp.]|nr:hypothetical protein [Pseudonocardia sp.]